MAALHGVVTWRHYMVALLGALLVGSPSDKRRQVHAGSNSLTFAGALRFSLVAAAVTRARSSRAGLKWGAYFAGIATIAAVFGLRPIRGGR